MWPWGHAALGYLLYSLYLRRGVPEQPTGWAVVILGFGTQFPDLVDKPLAWYLHVLPYGRTLTHSLLVAVPIILLVHRVASRRDQQPLSIAFGLGYLSHLLGDSLHAVLNTEWADLAFLVWPLLPIPNEDSETEGLIAHLLDIEGSPFFLFGLGVTVTGLGLWNAHGRPGFAEVVSVVRPRRPPSRSKGD